MSLFVYPNLKDPRSASNRQHHPWYGRALSNRATGGLERRVAESNRNAYPDILRFLRPWSGHRTSPSKRKIGSDKVFQLVRTYFTLCWWRCQYHVDRITNMHVAYFIRHIPHFRLSGSVMKVTQLSSLVLQCDTWAVVANHTL